MKLPAYFFSFSTLQLICLFAISRVYLVSVTASCEGARQRWHDSLTGASGSCIAAFIHPSPPLVTLVLAAACIYCEPQMGKCSAFN